MYNTANTVLARGQNKTHPCILNTKLILLMLYRRVQKLDCFAVSLVCSSFCPDPIQVKKRKEIGKKGKERIVNIGDYYCHCNMDDCFYCGKQCSEKCNDCHTVTFCCQEHLAFHRTKAHNGAKTFLKSHAKPGNCAFWQLPPLRG